MVSETPFCTVSRYRSSSTFYRGPAHQKSLAILLYTCPAYAVHVLVLHGIVESCLHLPTFSASTARSGDHLECVLEVGDDIVDALDADRDLHHKGSTSAQLHSRRIACRLTRIKSGVTPDAICSSAVSCWCVVDAEWMTSVFASPAYITQYQYCAP